MAELERSELKTNEGAHLRPACVDCTYQCNKLHADRRPEEEFDPDRIWPHFRKKMTKQALHDSPHSAICIPGTFMEDYPDTFRKGNPITLEGPSGNTWNVRALDRPILYSGWRAFAHDHRLREGDQLHFKLTKPSHFVVDIFDSNGDARRSARKATVTGKYATAPTCMTPSTPALQNQSRKRKEMVKTGYGYGVEIGHGYGVATIADRCKAPAKRGGCNEYAVGARLRFSAETKQWECREEKNVAREVVTILDSDDEVPEGSRRLELSFGSAHVQNYRSSKIERLIEYMKEEGDNIPPRSTPSVTRDVEAGDEKMVEKNHQGVSDAGQESESDVAEDENDNLDKERQTSSNPLRRFTTIFDTKPRETVKNEQAKKDEFEKPGVKDKMEKLGSTSDQLCQAQICCNEEMEEVTHDAPKNILPSTMEVHQKSSSEMQGTVENCTNIMNKVLQSYTIPITRRQEVAADHETVDNKLDIPTNTSQVSLPTTFSALGEDSISTLNCTAKSGKVTAVNGSRVQEKVQEVDGEFSFEKQENINNIPVIDTLIEGLRDGVHPLKQGLISRDLAEKHHETQVDDELHLAESKDSVHEECTSASETDKSCELPVAMITPEETPKMPVTIDPANEVILIEMNSPITQGSELQLKSGNEVDMKRQPALEELKVGHPQQKQEFKEFAKDFSPELTSDASHEKDDTLHIQARPSPLTKPYTTTCLLRSKRGQVTQVDREKTLTAAQSWAQKSRNPSFVAVMEGSNVYTDFNMDIPGEFGKQAKMPPTEVKVTLVCDEIPTNCKAIWVGNDAENPKLNAKGWMNFSRSHFLEEGDVCVFELVSRGAFRIKVHIFRIVGLKRSLLLDWTQHYKVLEPNPAGAQLHTP